MGSSVGTTRLGMSPKAFASSGPPRSRQAEAAFLGQLARDRPELRSLGRIQRQALGRIALRLAQDGSVCGLDKTTLTSLLDRLEQDGLVIRRADPRDRRARLPEATEAGRALQARVASSLARVESGLLSGFSAAEQHSLRSMLCHLIAAGEGVETHLAGSCV